jgi:hypothetical protein
VRPALDPPFTRWLNVTDWRLVVQFVVAPWIELTPSVAWWLKPGSPKVKESR